MWMEVAGQLPQNHRLSVPWKRHNPVQTQVSGRGAIRLAQNEQRMGQREGGSCIDQKPTDVLANRTSK